jgi:hypothetical protein
MNRTAMSTNDMTPAAMAAAGSHQPTAVLLVLVRRRNSHQKSNNEARMTQIIPGTRTCSPMECISGVAEYIPAPLAGLVPGSMSAHAVTAVSL